MATEKILLQFEADIKDLKAELGQVKASISGVEKEAQTAGSKMTNTFKNIGKAIVGAFAVREVVRFAGEVENLARQAEGVKKAFDRIATPGTLSELREATRGTVSDLKLMQSTVKAANFGLPIEQLATYFKFATQRARETGESIDYLVESIVLGISRKSIPILDNLGISASQLQEEMRKTGDIAQAVGNIIDGSMGDAEAATTDAADAADRAAAEYENLKVALGEQLLKVITPLRIAFNDFLATTTLALKSIKQIREEVFDAALDEDAANTLKYFRDWQKELSKTDSAYEDTSYAIGRYIELQKESLQALKEDIKINGLNESRLASRQRYEAGIEALEQYLQGLKDLEKNTDDSNKALKTHLQIIDELYPETNGLALAVENLGKAFAFMGQDTAQSLDILFDVDRIAKALNSDTFPALKDSTVDFEEQLRLLGFETLPETRDQFEAWFQGLNAGADAFGGLAFAMRELGKENERALGFAQQAALAQVIFAQWASIANALKIASTSSPDPITFFVALSSILGTIFATIGQATSILNGAKVPQYAEGVVDLKGTGTETSDSIHARLSRGESVITAKGTRQDKGLFEAANKMQLEKYINENYVLPALVKVKSEERQMFDDYRLYLALKDGQKQDRDLNKKLIQVLSRRDNRYNSWA